MLLTFIILYMLGTLLIGYWASRRVKNTADFVVAGKKLPLAVAGSALFATWFGSETIMGAPSQFVEGGLLSVMEDPFGAALCLFLVGMFVAKPLYKLNIITFNDYYRMRYSRKVEIVSSVFMVPSYFGWIAAQMVAMALLLNVLLGWSMGFGIVMCSVVVMFYTYIGGMWAVSVTDFVQTIIIVIGLLIMAVQLNEQAGGVVAIIAAQPEGFFRFLPPPTLHDVVYYVAAWITIGLGSIPQQDVFQRVMAAKNERTAIRSGYLGGFMYLTIGFIPLFIGLCAKILHPELLQDDPQKLLLSMTLKYGTPFIQIMLFGAILSAILSTTSGAILAPATVIGENLVKPFYPKLNDGQLLMIMRIAVVGVTLASMAMAFGGQSIFELVGQSSALSLVSLFVPLVGGLYWKQANASGAIWSMVLGMAVWIWFEFFTEGHWPPLIPGFMASILGMVAGSIWQGHRKAQKIRP